jgi:hypothetical protein
LARFAEGIVMHRRIVAVVAASAVALLAVRSGLPRPEDYGFADLINSRFNDGLFGLAAADVDSDGDMDLVVVNNPKARIDFLLQRAPGEALPDDAATRLAGNGVNELPDELHFRRDSFPTEQKVSALAVGDWNGDGKNDLAFTGDSGKLTVVYRNAKGGFGDRVRFDVDDVAPSREAVRSGDLNGDGRADLAVLGKKRTFLFLQGSDGKLVAAPELLNATASADGFALVDLDGDQKLDLLYVKAEAEAPLRWRIARGGGDFGPERLFPFTELRSYTCADLDHDGRAEVAAVRRRSGRVAIVKYQGDAAAAKTGELLLSQPRVVAYATQKDEKPRDELLADLDGDGKAELIVAEPSAARVVVYRRDPDGLACRGESFPSFVGARAPRLADLDGDGKKELIVVAPNEGAIGVAKISNDGGSLKIAFPEARAAQGEQLLALDVAPLVDGEGGRPSIVALTVSGKGSKKTYQLVRLAAAAGTNTNNENVTTDLGTLPADPSDLLLVDLNRDGLRDVLVFIPTELPRILLAKQVDGKLAYDAIAAQDVPGLGILKGVEKTALFFGDVDGDGKPELLVPGPNFARAFTLGAKGIPTVVGQWNLDDSGAKVACVAAADLDGDHQPEIVVGEKTTKSLRVLKGAAGAAKALAKIELGDFDVRGIRAGDLDGDGRDDLVLLAPERFAVVQSARNDAGFAELSDFESPLKNAFLDELAFGDVNGDGVLDAVITETNRHLVTISAWVDQKLNHVLQFPIYEESIFERDGGGGKEPRELVLADVTGDKKLDIAILVHDRVIVYPQE